MNGLAQNQTFPGSTVVVDLATIATSLRMVDVNVENLHVIQKCLPLREESPRWLLICSFGQMSQVLCIGKLLNEEWSNLPFWREPRTWHFLLLIKIYYLFFSSENSHLNSISFWRSPKRLVLLGYWELLYLRHRTLEFAKLSSSHCPRRTTPGKNSNNIVMLKSLVRELISVTAPKRNGWFSKGN